MINIRPKEKAVKAAVIVPKFGAQKTEGDDKRNGLYNVLVKLRLELGDSQSKGESANEELLGKLSFMR